MRGVQRVIDGGETSGARPRAQRHVDEGYVRRMKKGLRHWVDGGRSGYLAWGIFRFDAPWEHAREGHVGGLA